jgi:hypothetical protein
VLVPIGQARGRRSDRTAVKRRRRVSAGTSAMGVFTTPAIVRSRVVLDEESEPPGTSQWVARRGFRGAAEPRSDEDPRRTTLEDERDTGEAAPSGSTRRGRPRRIGESSGLASVRSDS